jgi:outer membrane protein OmpA-like peptidoglycan-associated protein
MKTPIKKSKLLIILFVILFSSCIDYYKISTKVHADGSLERTIKVKGERISGKQMVEVMNAMEFDLVTFGNHEFDLKEESRVELDILVGLLKREPELRVEVGGHTDNVGSDENNLELSGNRANSVKGYLASKGIEAMRIETKGYGAAEPIETNDTDEGRARNRRVELKIL